MVEPASEQHQQERQEQKSFKEIKGDIENIMDKIINEKFKTQDYSSSEAEKWSNEIAEQVITQA